MRRSLIFSCADETLLGTVDNAKGSTGILIVTGGRQTRVGPHRMMTSLAGDLSEAGHPVFRYDRRGVGDSSGSDPDFRESGPDILSAAAAFRAACPHIRTLWALGLCDGASALALNHRVTSFGGLILLNPWVVETQAGSPSPSAVRAHYRERLLTTNGWRHLLRRGFNPLAALKGVRTAFSATDQSLASDVMASLAQFGGPVHILLAERDATARAYLGAYAGEPGAPLRRSRRVMLGKLDSASHSFAGASDQAWLRARILGALNAN